MDKIEQLKTSAEMWVWDEQKSDRIKVNVVHITPRGQAVTKAGVVWQNYELIKEPNHRPYNKEDDLTVLLGLKIKNKSKQAWAIITAIDEDLEVYTNSYYTLEELFDEWEHLDGTPLGVKEC